MSATITSYKGELCHITDDIEDDTTSNYSKVKTRCNRHLTNYMFGGYGIRYRCQKCGTDDDFELVHKNRKKVSSKWCHNRMRSRQL